MLKITCRSLGTEWCDFEALGPTVEDIQQQFVIHGEHVHQIPPDQMRGAEVRP